MYLSASVVAVSTWGAISSVRPYLLKVTQMTTLLSLVHSCGATVLVNMLVSHVHLLNLLTYNESYITTVTDIASFA